jgi:short-subunit dehydrogenase
MNKTAIVFGANGGIGFATCRVLAKNGYTVVTVTRDQIDFTNELSDTLITGVLTLYDADLIINCSGYFAKNSEHHKDTMEINVGSNWSIVRHYMNAAITKPVKVIMVGSSAYKSGRKNYILYSASKAALYNLWQGSAEYFANTPLSLSLINPGVTRTRMSGNPTHDNCLEPEDVANRILEMASNDDNECIDLQKELK